MPRYNVQNPEEPQSFKWCTDCKEYDQEKHCCHRFSKVIRDTVEEMKQEPTTKNNLGVDAVSRQEVLYLVGDYDLSMGQVVKGIHALPSVTPQEPKTGHWIEQIDHEENCRTLICSNCGRPALHDDDSIWKHKFCPHCGAKMVEPQESEDKE